MVEQIFLNVYLSCIIAGNRFPEGHHKDEAWQAAERFVMINCLKYSLVSSMVAGYNKGFPFGFPRKRFEKFHFTTVWNRSHLSQ